MTTVPAGTTVFLSYNGFQEHDLTFITVNQQGNTIFTSDPDCPPNVTISYHCSKIFDPGTYRFFCTLHQNIDDAAELIVNNP
jgi:plastocyanin